MKTIRLLFLCALSTFSLCQAKDISQQLKATDEFFKTLPYNATIVQSANEVAPGGQLIARYIAPGTNQEMRVYFKSDDDITQANNGRFSRSVQQEILGKIDGFFYGRKKPFKYPQMIPVSLEQAQFSDDANNIALYRNIANLNNTKTVTIK